MGERRFPVGPLERLAECRFPSDVPRGTGEATMLDRPGRALQLVAEHAGFGPHAVSRWRRSGIPYWQADRMASQVGEHPCRVWDDWPIVFEEESA